MPLASVVFRRAVLAVAACASLAGAQNAPDTTRRTPTAPNSDLPLIPTRPLKFTTNEGTWMSLDVSPDGRTIVFDLLGDLYTLPVSGGTATRITSGSGFDGQPRFSPDGRHVVFVSDRSGGENLWIVDADGKNVRPLTRGNGQSYASPEWTPDGQYIVSSRSQGGTMDLWMYHKDGGSGLRLTGQTQGAAQPPQGPGGGGGGFNHFMGAAPAPDGRYIYANARTGGSQYNQMLGTAWQVVMYDRQTGRVHPQTRNMGAGMRPAISPDGRTLAYASRRMAVTGLKLRDLASGDERWIADEIQRDDMESRGSRDALPGYSWMPDSRSLVLSHHGKFWRIDAANGRQTEIPFTAEVDQMIGDLVQFEYDYNDTLLTVRQIRSPRLSPDGRRLAFSALDQLYVMDWPSGKPARLTSNAGGEFNPVWSPDGRYIAFVTWSDSGGDIWRIAADGRGRPEKLTTQPAFFSNIEYSPTGSRIVATRAPRSQRAVVNDEINPKLIITELVWIPSGGGAATLITPVGNAGRPHFTTDSTRVFLYEGGNLTSFRWDGTDRKEHLRLTGFSQGQGGPGGQGGRTAQEILIAPDGQRALALIDNKVYIVPVPVTGGTTPTISVNQPNSASVPLRLVSRIGGDFPAWASNGRMVTYALGRSTFLYDLGRADSLVADSMAKAIARTDPPARPAGGDAPRGKPVYEATRTDITITVAKDRPVGTVVLRNARIITMKGDEVIERGDVVVTNNRVSAVGASGSVAIPSGARSIDVTGKTIMPGLVDIHAHMWPLWGVHAPQPYMYLANLAYGVTTTRDPQTSQTDVITYGDAVETGQMIGPRVYATGPGIFLYDNVSSLDDARAVMKRYSDHYQTQTIKQYMAGERRQRQWIAMAAKEQRITPTLEGGLDFKKNLTEAMDGYAGIEHSLPIAPIYKDVVQLFAASGTVYTPTLLVQYGGPWAENYWYESYDIFSDEKLKRFTPFSELERRGLRRPQWFRENEYSFKLLAEQARKILEGGGRIGLGGHGQLQGLGVHWELWTIASGGMKPVDALRVGTIIGAEAIGLGKQIGSVEAGKLADIVVLDANPLEDIRNTNTIRYVMKNGRLYDGNTLAEIWPRQRDVARQWWMTNDAVPGNGGSGSR